MTLASTAASFIGRVLADRYRLDSVIGTGGMGGVYEARDLQNDMRVAVKVLHQIGTGSEDFHQRFFDEALIIGEMFHPNIVQIVGFDRDKDGTPFLIMELLTGKDLYDVLKEREKLPLDQALEILRQVGSALHAAHNIGVAHRDIKPSNIFLARQKSSSGEEAEVVKVVDFGLSKELANTGMRRTAQGMILGTLEYVSPEGTQGDSNLVDFHSDQWALAVVAYRMLAGRLPFEGSPMPKLLSAIRDDPPKPLRDFAPNLPEHVVKTIERGLAKKKEDRFESVQDFVRALNGLPPLSQSLSSAAERSRSGRVGRRGQSSTGMTPLKTDSAAPAEIKQKPEPVAPPKKSPWLMVGVGLVAVTLVGFLLILLRLLKKH